jgi:hypothetical protein
MIKLPADQLVSLARVACYSPYAQALLGGAFLREAYISRRQIEQRNIAAFPRETQSISSRPAAYI